MSGHSTGSGSFTLTIRSARLYVLGEDNFRSVLGVLLIADAAALAGAFLDQDFVAEPGQLLDADRHDGDARFVRLDFIGNADHVFLTLRHQLASLLAKERNV